MKQQRLDIFARKVSDEELSLQEKISQLEIKIRKQRNDIDNLIDKLEATRKRQQESGLRTAEITITDEYIKERLRPLKKHLRLLESKYEGLINNNHKAKKLATQQTDLF